MAESRIDTSRTSTEIATKDEIATYIKECDAFLAVIKKVKKSSANTWQRPYV